MAMTRTQLVTTVAADLAGPIALGDFAATDTSGGLKEGADRCFRALGFPEGELAAATVPDGEEERAIVYLRYFVLDKAVSATASKMNVKAGSAAANLSEQHEHLVQLRDQARLDAEGYGLVLAGSASGYAGVFTVASPR